MPLKYEPLVLPKIAVKLDEFYLGGCTRNKSIGGYETISRSQLLPTRLVRSVLLGPITIKNDPELLMRGDDIHAIQFHG